MESSFILQYIRVLVYKHTNQPANMRTNRPQLTLVSRLPHIKKMCRINQTDSTIIIQWKSYRQPFTRFKNQTHKKMTIFFLNTNLYSRILRMWKFSLKKFPHANSINKLNSTQARGKQLLQLFFIATIQNKALPRDWHPLRLGCQKSLNPICFFLSTCATHLYLTNISPRTRLCRAAWQPHPSGCQFSIYKMDEETTQWDRFLLFFYLPCSNFQFTYISLDVGDGHFQTDGIIINIWREPHWRFPNGHLPCPCWDCTQ